MYNLTFLGETTFTFKQQPLVITHQQHRLLLAYIAEEGAAEGGQTHLRARLAQQLWPDLSGKQARNHLRQAFFRLRKLFAEAGGDTDTATSLLLINQSTVRFQHESAAVDTIAFQAAAAQAQISLSQPTTNESSSTLQGLQTLVRLYQGEFLADFDPAACGLLEEWLYRKRLYYRESVMSALRRLMDHQSACGAHQAALTTARHLVTIEPWDEVAHRLIARSLLFLGQRSAAYSHLHSLRETVAVEAGHTLTTETLGLLQQLAQAPLGDNGAADAPPVDLTLASEPSAQPVANPYKGLEHFSYADAALFFGRQRFVERLLQDIQRAPIVMLTGTSGSGKSSVVQAGLLPRLLGADANDGAASWQVATMRPGRLPLQALGMAMVELFPPHRFPAVRAINEWMQQLLHGHEPAFLQSRLHGNNSHSDNLHSHDSHGNNSHGNNLHNHHSHGNNSQRDPLHRDPLHRDPLYRDPLYRDSAKGEGEENGEGRAAIERLLVIDQFEEIFTLTPDPTTCKEILDRLVVLAGSGADGAPVRLLLVMRADFMLQVAGHAGLTNAIQDATVILPPMDSGEIQQVIEEPARRRQVHFEPGLVARLINDIGDDVGRLPLLQFALDQLWQRRQERWLTHHAYEEMEELRGALSHYADGIYARLTPEQQLQARRIFLQLVQPGEMSVNTRRPATHSELGSELWPLVQYLVDRRLLVTNLSMRMALTEPAASNSAHGSQHFPEQQHRNQLTQPVAAEHVGEIGSTAAANGEEEQTVEVIHEALIHEWERLRGWLREDQHFWLWLRRLRTTARMWQTKAHDSGVLLRGALLTEAEEWLAMRRADLPALVHNFIRASVQERQQEVAVAQAQREREQALLWTMLAQNALNQHDLDLALAAALEANVSPHAPAQAQVMLGEAAYTPRTQSLLQHDSAVRDMALHPDGQHLVTVEQSGRLSLWDVDSGRRLVLLAFPQASLLAVALHANGEDLLCGTDEGELLFLSFATLLATNGSADRAAAPMDGYAAAALQRRWQGAPTAIAALAFHPTARLAFAGAANGTITAWELATGQRRHALDGHSDIVYTLAVSSDGEQLLSGSADRSLNLWEIATGQRIRHFPGRPHLFVTETDDTERKQETTGNAWGHGAAVFAAIFLPNGKQAISTSLDQHLCWWDLTTGRRTHSILPNHQGVGAVALSPDGRYLLVGTHSGDLLHWPLFQGASPVVLAGHGAQISATLFLDQSRGISAAADGTVRVWSLRNGAEVRRLHEGHPASAIAVAISPDGRLGATAMHDGEIWLWDYGTGAIQRKLIGHTDFAFGGLAFTPDGRHLLSGSGDVLAQANDTTVRLWDVERGEAVHIFRQHTDAIWDIALSPDGSLAASAGKDGQLWRWDLQRGEGHLLVDRAPQAIRGICFSPDGSKLLYGIARTHAYQAADYRLCLIDVATGRAIRYFVGHEDLINAVAISPDGKWALSASNTNDLFLWDLASGRLQRRLKGHTASVFDLSFSPDGTLVASSDSDGTILIWHVAEATLLTRLHAHERWALSITFTPDSNHLLSAAIGSPVCEWRIDRSVVALKSWIDANRYQAPLTAEVRQELGFSNAANQDSV